MPKVIEQRGILTTAVVALGERGGVTGSVRQQVHDGDTIVVTTSGNFGVRFLGVDAPEISFTLPGERAFTGTGHPRWEAFLKDPLSSKWGEFKKPLAKDLAAWIKKRSGPGTAQNHHYHAVEAEAALEAEVAEDLKRYRKTPEDFRFFLAFATEVLDRYGRFLGYINIDLPDADRRPPSYNERLLMQGRLLPYFIWPNVNPFRRQTGLRDSALKPGKLQQRARAEKSLSDARGWVADARKKKLGVYAKADPLRLEAFEVRFLARRQPPDRWVIDLSRDDDHLIAPQRYVEVPHPEDRLFVPSDYVPLFREKGWKAEE